jgi:hypothetical protein
MAIAFTQLAAMSTSTSNTNSYAGTAGTPAANDLLICGVLASDTVVAPTMTGTWTWRLLTSFTFNTVDSIHLFWAVATAGSSTTPTFDCAGDNATGALIYCVRVTGAEGQIQPYVRQIATNTGSTANPSVTFAKAVLAGNGVFSFAANNTNSSTQWTNPASWSTDVENTFNTPPHGLAFSGRSSGETGTVITWTNANTSVWGVIAVELYVSGSGPIESDNGLVGFYGGFTN